mmetsp:Transcript_50582/g.100687  ORF Transcript_50582/g.100687 Transcript_50582/m.100687 type:complete len:119 (+) Transcript_50582:120-476(+)
MVTARKSSPVLVVSLTTKFRSFLWQLCDPRLQAQSTYVDKCGFPHHFSREGSIQSHAATTSISNLQSSLCTLTVLTQVLEGVECSRRSVSAILPISRRVTMVLNEQCELVDAGNMEHL